MASSSFLILQVFLTSLLLLLSTKHVTAAAAFLYNHKHNKQPLLFSRPPQPASLRLFSSNIESFTGPTILNDDAEIRCSLELQELGLVLSVAESSVAGALGLFVRISDDVDQATLPAMTLLAGYAKGTFYDKDQGDKTVGFSLFSMDAPVFFNRQLMTIQEAMACCCVATKTTSSSETLEQQEVRVAGHDVYYDEEEDKIVILPTSSSGEPLPFCRYFVPNGDDEMNVTNFGQYCNDRAFQIGMDMVDPTEYMSRCETENCVRLAWRLEFDEKANMLKPSWPVSILSRDMRFCNREPIELGTTYGWSYWNATIELDRL
jgi:hypothetical protein